MCFICNETVALVTMKHSMHTSNNITPHNSEVRSRNHLQSSYQATCSVIVTVYTPHNKSVHTSTYCCESAFSTMNMVKNKTGAHSLMNTTSVPPPGLHTFYA